MRLTAAPTRMLAASPDAVLAAAIAIAVVVVAALPLVDMLPCVKLWLHGAVACMP